MAKRQQSAALLAQLPSLLILHVAVVIVLLIKDPVMMKRFTLENGRCIEGHGTKKSFGMAALNGKLNEKMANCTTALDWVTAWLGN